MTTFEEKIEKACSDLEIPGIVFAASSADGKFKYEKSFGTRSLKDPSPLKLDSTMWLASCTKFMTTIAAMQCVEKGLLDLDEDVTRVLPELKGREILTGFEEGSGKPILVKNEKPITLRHLLTHQSGLGYDLFNPVLLQYQATVGITPVFGGPRSIVDSYAYPLLFSPGESWQYSVGIDWAGHMVERVTNKSLEDYLEQNIWAPLGMINMTFFPKTKPNVMSRLADMSQRDCRITIFGSAENPDAKLVYTDNTIWDLDTPVCHGGAGCYGSPFEYQKMLHSICSDDGKLLKSSTIDEMFKPQLTDAARASFQASMDIPEMSQGYGGLPAGTKVDWGLGGMMNLNAVSGRSAGTLAWGGYPNLLWWCDRAAGMCGISGSQINPPADKRTNEWFHRWTTELYKRTGITVKEKL